MSVSTDSQYDARSRQIFWRIEFYFDGLSNNPVEVTRDNYLVTSEVLEEATSGNTIFDSVSSNELSATLLSRDGRFNPDNTQGPYYGKIKRGLLARAYIKAAVADDWDKLGDFYISSWEYSVVTKTATIVANDRLYNLFGLSAANIVVTENTPVANLITSFFNFFGMSCNVEDTITAQLPWAFCSEENKEFLTSLTQSFFLFCLCGRDGLPVIKNVIIPSTVRATFTDANQVISADMSLSLDSDYDAAHLTYCIPQKSDEVDLLTLSNFILAPGSNVIDTDFTNTPVLCITAVQVSSEQSLFNLTALNCTSRRASATLNNPNSVPKSGSIVFRGMYLDCPEYDIGTAGDNILEVRSRYIQDAAAASAYYRRLSKFASNALPVVQLQIRGNPNLRIGDKIHVTSARYAMDFTGILVRQHFYFDGGLRSDITLLNTALLEVPV